MLMRCSSEITLVVCRNHGNCEEQEEEENDDEEATTIQPGNVSRQRSQSSTDSHKMGVSRQNSRVEERDRHRRQPLKTQPPHQGYMNPLFTEYSIKQSPDIKMQLVSYVDLDTEIVLRETSSEDSLNFCEPDADEIFNEALDYLHYVSDTLDSLQSSSDQLRTDSDAQTQDANYNCFNVQLYSPSPYRSRTSRDTENQRYSASKQFEKEDDRLSLGSKRWNEATVRSEADSKVTLWDYVPSTVRVSDVVHLQGSAQQNHKNTSGFHTFGKIENEISPVHSQEIVKKDNKRHRYELSERPSNEVLVRPLRSTVNHVDIPRKHTPPPPPPPRTSSQRSPDFSLSTSTRPQLIDTGRPSYQSQFGDKSTRYSLSDEPARNAIVDRRSVKSSIIFSEPVLDMSVASNALPIQRSWHRGHRHSARSYSPTDDNSSDAGEQVEEFFLPPSDAMATEGSSTSFDCNMLPTTEDEASGTCMTSSAELVSVSSGHGDLLCNNTKGHVTLNDSANREVDESDQESSDQSEDQSIYVDR